jgi:hypothetical protein
MIDVLIIMHDGPDHLYTYSDVYLYPDGHLSSINPDDEELNRINMVEI